MSSATTIDRKFLISLADDFLTDKKTLRDLDMIATSFLFLDKEYKLDKKEPKLVRNFLFFLQEPAILWSSNIGKSEIKIYKQILLEVDDETLANEALYFLRYRDAIGNILRSYLKKEITRDQVIESTSDWNYPEAVKFFNTIFKEFQNDQHSLECILNDFKEGSFNAVLAIIKSSSK